MEEIQSGKISVMFIAITGSTGVGKSTVAEQVAKTMEPACHIDLDVIKHLVVTCFKYDASETGLRQWRLLGRNAAQLVRNFLDEGYSVVVNGMVEEEVWNEIFTVKRPDVGVILTAAPGVNISRDAGRAEAARMGEYSVHQHKNYFAHSRAEFFKDFRVIDTSTHGIDESVRSVLALIT
jgi:thymidylate kinase